MKDNNHFGKRLRELRAAAGMSLRELADKVNVNFTYLSKIENGALPPPSERVIRRLAETLNVDKDELLTLAGIIPPDIAEMLKERETLARLRAERAKRQAAANRKPVTMPKVSIPVKGLYRLAIPVLLVMVMATTLWFASPTQALEIAYPSLPSSGTLGSAFTFTVKVSIEDTELLPLQQVDITIYKADNRATYKATLLDLPKNDRSAASHTISEGSSSGTATVTADADSTWGYFEGTGYAMWKGTGYSFTPSTTYGYGYQGGTGTTSITYTIVWTSPSSWPAGNYKIETKLTTTSYGNGNTFTETSSTFTLSSAQAPSGGGGGGGGVAPEEVTAQDIEEMTIEEAAAAVEELSTKDAADIIEELSASMAASIFEEVAIDKAAAIIEEVSTDKAVAIIEELTTQKAADIMARLTTQRAVDIITGITTQKAAEIIEGLTTDKNVSILEAVSAGKAVEILEILSSSQAATILEKLTKEKTLAIMEQMSIEKLSETIAAMSETSLIEILPDLSIDKLFSIEREVLFEALPGVSTDHLVREVPPKPAAGLEAPMVVYSTTSGAKYLTAQTMAGEWASMMATTLEPVNQLMVRTSRALKDVGTSLEISENQPPEVLSMLKSEWIVNTYLTVDFENATADDIELGHISFQIEKEWLEQNSVHKWSVALQRYNPELNQWIAMPTKRVSEDDTYVHYTAAITPFSVFAIAGSETLPPLAFQVTDLDISPAMARTGDDVTISADVTNTSGNAGIYVATLWIDDTIVAGKNISIGAGDKATVSFATVLAEAASYDVRIDRLAGSLTISKPALPKPAPAPEPEVIPEPVPTPAPEPVPVPAPAPEAAPEPVAETNWWLIGGIIAIVVLIGVGVWQYIVRRREYRI